MKPESFDCTAGRTFAPAPWLDDKYQKAIKDLMHKHALACDELTGNQLASVIAQALACGDLVKYVRASGNDQAQNVVYLPYAEAERLRNRVRNLEELLKQNGIEEPEACDVV